MAPLYTSCRTVEQCLKLKLLVLTHPVLDYVTISTIYNETCLRFTH